MNRCLSAALLLSLVVVGCTPREASRTPGGVASSAAAEGGFTIPALEGSSPSVSLADQRGKVVLLDFWATWCPPCRSELPRLNALHDSLKDRGFTVIGMTVDRDDAAQVAAAVKECHLVYPVGLAGPEVQQAYGKIRAVPTKFLLDRNGVVQKRYVGVVPEGQLRQDIEGLLAR